MISFEKEPNEVWHSEYKILYNGYYVGNIAKYNKRGCWYVFVNYVFTPIKGNDCFKTLKEAKEKVVEKLSPWS